VQAFANQVIAERGVRHGHVVYMPAAKDMGHSHGHTHSQPRPRRRTA
jgi:CopG family nickel-responsive transcriptional regulator